MLDKLKKLADQAKEKAAPLAEQAAHRAAELASEARVKAGPLAEQAKERAVDLAGKAAPAVTQGVDKAAERIDKATGGKYSSHLDKVQVAVHGTASKVAATASGQSRGAGQATETVTTAADPFGGTSTTAADRIAGTGYEQGAEATTAADQTPDTATGYPEQNEVADGSAASAAYTEAPAHQADEGTGQEPLGS